MVKTNSDEKTPRHSVSGRSYFTSTPEISNVAVFEVREYRELYLWEACIETHAQKTNKRVF